MKVILLENVPGLGGPDDVKEVSEGHARNFLFPRHLAVAASTQSLKNVGTRQKQEATASARELKEAEQLAENIDGLEVEFNEKANEVGVLYAALNSQKIAGRLQELGYAVKKSQLVVPPIKNAGQYNIRVKLPHGLEADCRVLVVAIAKR